MSWGSHRFQVAVKALAAAGKSVVIWYADKRPGLGVEFVAVVGRAFEAIRENPRGPPLRQPPRNRLLDLREWFYPDNFDGEDHAGWYRAVS